MKILSLILCLCLLLSGCAAETGSGSAATNPGLETAPEPTVKAETPKAEVSSPFSDRDMDASFSEADGTAILLSGDRISCASDAVQITGTTATIRKAGTYLLSGTLEEGAIVVDTEKNDKVQIVLNGVTIHSETTAPVFVRQADKVFVTLAPGTQNRLSNGGSFTPDGDTNVDAVIFSKEDLTLNGTGALSIASPGGHGIVSKDSLRFAGGTYTIEAASHGLCGKDEVSIADGQFDITTGKDGIHAENSKDTDAGTVWLEGGTYRISADGDGVSASGSCVITEGTYVITAGGGSENGKSHTTQGFGWGNRGGQPPADAATSATQSTGQSSRPPKQSGGKGFDKGNRQPGKGTQSPAAEESDSVSSKGIKAGSLTIAGGCFTLDTADDGLHSGGNLTIQGGTLEIASGDDGIHADETVAILSGSVRITESYEGIEGQHLDIRGGEITLTASDDGLNAAGGNDGSGFGFRGDIFAQSGDTPGIVISGGTVYITASGDGIDANGTLEITGGTVVVCGPTYGDTSVLDFDRTGTISGGTFIGTGAATMAQTFSGSTQGVISVRVGTQPAGTQITLTDPNGTVLLSVTPELDFEIVILSAPAMQSGESYTLSIGNTVQSLTAK